MGIFDKVKEQAEKAKAQAQDLKGKVGDKVDEVQSKRKADDLLDDLGRFLYAEKTGRPLPAADSEISRLVDELKGLEAQGVPILSTDPVSASAPTAAESAATPSATIADSPDTASGPEAPTA
ncbi:MAG: hypothetical protein QOK39_1705 [Acidimicrobiaceae bacterium]|jgi:hypothetical protein|nr:hypothetical protein [Acidimicrobiaceae bacterium]